MSFFVSSMLLLEDRLTSTVIVLSTKQQIYLKLFKDDCVGLATQHVEQMDDK